MERLFQVAICIPTYQRPIGLTRLLESINALTYDKLCVIVVDNDSSGSAKPVVDAARSSLRFTIDYVIEFERGIATARNRLVQEAMRLNVEYIFFIDDDQTIEPFALSGLIDVAKRFNLDNVKAQDIPVYDSGMPQWVIESGFFEEVPRWTGKPVRNFGANGVLLRLAAATQVPGPFDHRFSFTGGSDGMFFAQFHEMGFRSGGCREAIVREFIPVTRGTRAWMFRRSFRAGVVKGMIVREVAPSLGKNTRWAIISLSYGFGNLVATIWYLFRRRPRWVRALSHVGMAGGLFVSIILGERALRHREYETVHGA